MTDDQHACADDRTDSATDPFVAPVPLQEHSDVNVKRLLQFLLGLTVALAIIASGVYWQYHRSLNIARASQESLNPFAAKRSPPPPPRLQTSPADDLQRFRQREEERLASWQWDRSARFARIPIDRAIDWIAINGRPSWPAEDKTNDTPESSSNDSQVLEKRPPVSPPRPWREQRDESPVDSSEAEGNSQPADSTAPTAAPAASPLTSTAPTSSKRAKSPVNPPDADRVARSTKGAPSLLTEVGILQKLGQDLPVSAHFRNEDGQLIQLRQFFGDRPVVVAMVYYRCPMLCGELLQQLTRSLAALDLVAHRDYELIVISIDPTETSALASQKKKHFVARASRTDANLGWHFLTGESAEIKQIADTIGFHYRYDPPSGQFAHASGIVILTPQAKISQYFLGLDYPTPELRRALVHAAGGRLGSPVERLLLLCFHYDPKTGRYGLAIANVLRWTGIMTAGTILGYISVQLVRERRRRRSS